MVLGSPAVPLTLARGGVVDAGAAILPELVTLGGMVAVMLPLLLREGCWCVSWRLMVDGGPSCSAALERLLLRCVSGSSAVTRLLSAKLPARRLT